MVEKNVLYAWKVLNAVLGTERSFCAIWYRFINEYQRSDCVALREISILIIKYWQPSQQAALISLLVAQWSIFKAQQGKGQGPQAPTGS